MVPLCACDCMLAVYWGPVWAMWLPLGAGWVIRGQACGAGRMACEQWVWVAAFVVWSSSFGAWLWLCFNSIAELRWSGRRKAVQSRFTPPRVYSYTGSHLPPQSLPHLLKWLSSIRWAYVFQYFHLCLHVLFYDTQYFQSKLLRTIFLNLNNPV